MQADIKVGELVEGQRVWIFPHKPKLKYEFNENPKIKQLIEIDGNEYLVFGKADPALWPQYKMLVSVVPKDAYQDGDTFADEEKLVIPEVWKL